MRFSSGKWIGRCLYTVWIRGRFASRIAQNAAVEFAFAGDLVGLGFLEDHTEFATAVAMNMREGMDPHLVEEPSAPVASFPKVSADQLAHILSLFQTLDLTEDLNRLSLKDLDSFRKA